MGRDALRLRRAQTGTAGERGRTDRLVPAEPRRLQVPALSRVHGIAEDEHGEGSEVQIAGDGEGRLTFVVSPAKPSRPLADTLAALGRRHYLAREPRLSAQRWLPPLQNAGPPPVSRPPV